MKVVTWNVNGIRARGEQVLEWIARESPDVVCLQEVKAHAAQVPANVARLEDFWCCWHGGGGYSGVALHLRKSRWPAEPEFTHPAFDAETRIVHAVLDDLVIASVYVPNGGKDFAGKVAFLEAMAAYVDAVHASGRRLLLCGDLNVTRTDRDVHPKERKRNGICQRPEERALLEAILARGVVDVGRALHPDDDELFTWWAPWRNLRQRNIGWRLDYVLASEGLAARALSCTSHREFGTSDHAPVEAVFDEEEGAFDGRP
ncbi:exodeoxyribonuclease III [bacterium]|nr:exodeoxyribonuclease III [bacterium]